MPTSESLYNAVINNDINLLTPGSIVDYGFFELQKEDCIELFKIYSVIAKLMIKEKFISTMHNAYINKNLDETVNKLINELPDICKNKKIKPIYI